jgi:hypothetical protein
MNLWTASARGADICRIPRWRMHTPTPPEVDPDAPLPNVDPDPEPDDDRPADPSHAPEGDPPTRQPPVHAMRHRARRGPAVDDD